MLRPYGLQTEQRTSRSGWDEPRPRLSWKLRQRPARRRAERLPDHRRRAADGPGRPGPPAVGQRSARVRRRAARAVGRPGAAVGHPLPLAGRGLGRDRRRGRSAQSWFETGLLHRDDWTAVWIGRDPLGLPPVDPPQDDDRDPSTGFAAPPLYLRREFELDRRPVRARLYATARGVYEPRLNGSRVGDAELAPGWTEYHQRLQYQTYDVTDAGAARAATCSAPSSPTAGGAGTSASTPAARRSTTATRPAFLAQLVVDFADGSRQVVATDAGWTEQPGAIRSRRPADGPARRRPPPPARLGRARRGPTASGRSPCSTPSPGRWSPSPTTRCGSPATCRRSRCTARTGPVHRRLRTEPGRPGAADRPRTPRRGGGSSCGTPRSSPTASCTWTTCAAPQATDVYIAGGDATEVFEPQFTFHGFRYARDRQLPR